jgi:hypothetical protein
LFLHKPRCIVPMFLVVRTICLHFVRMRPRQQLVCRAACRRACRCRRWPN